MTAQWPGGANVTLFNSPAEAISPLGENGYKYNPSIANGGKVIISDTDHLWGVGGDYKWVWKSFLRGLNPIFMDPYNVTGFDVNEAAINLIRKNMGYTLGFAHRMNLVGMQPQPSLVSSGYCLALPGNEYLAYAPAGAVTVDLSGATGTFKVEWFSPLTGASKTGTHIQGGRQISFIAPFHGSDAVLHLKTLGGK